MNLRLFILASCFGTLTGAFASEGTAFGTELKCRGWFQGKGQFKHVPMVLAKATDQLKSFKLSLEGYEYIANWDIALDTVYVTISQGGHAVLFTTARVPTAKHNDTFSSAYLPGQTGSRENNGVRVSVSCNF